MTTPDTLPEERSAALLRERARRVFEELPSALAGNEEAVHQLRVALRRLRVALRLLAAPARPRRLARVQRVLRRLTRTAGPARDLDVLVGLLEDRVAALDAPGAELRALLGRLRAARARAHAQLAPAILDLDIDGLRRGLRRLQQRGPDGAERVLLRGREFREARASALLRGFSATGERFLPDALHALRRQVRRLRYAAEVEDVVRGEACRAAELWKRLQEAIGAIHDRHLLARWLHEQAEAAAARGQTSLARAAGRERRLVIDEVRQLHAALLRLRPADLALRALDASARRRIHRMPRGEGGVDAAPDHPPRDRGRARDTGNRR